MKPNEIVTIAYVYVFFFGWDIFYLLNFFLL